MRREEEPGRGWGELGTEAGEACRPLSSCFYQRGINHYTCMCAMGIIPINRKFRSCISDGRNYWNKGSPHIKLFLRNLLLLQQMGDSTFPSK